MVKKHDSLPPFWVLCGFLTGLNVISSASGEEGQGARERGSEGGEGGLPRRGTRLPRNPLPLPCADVFNGPPSPVVPLPRDEAARPSMQLLSCSSAAYSHPHAAELARRVLRCRCGCGIHSDIRSSFATFKTHDARHVAKQLPIPEWMQQ